MSTFTRQPEPGPPETRLLLAALDTAPGCARSHLKVVALGWAIEKERIEVAELLLSELTTNAFQSYLPDRMPKRAGWLADLAPEIEVRLTRRADRLLLEVWDANPYPPQARLPGETTENGRGLLLVDELSLRWGWYYSALLSEAEPPVLGFGRFQPAPRPIEIGQRVLTGKVVWCELALTDAVVPTGS